MLLVDASDLVDVGDAAVVVVVLFKVLAVVFVMMVVFVVLELAMAVLSMLDGELVAGRMNTTGQERNSPLKLTLICFAAMWLFVCYSGNNCL